MQLKSIQRTKVKKRTIPIRVTEAEYIKIKNKACTFNTTVSGWLRYTGVNYNPTDEELSLTGEFEDDDDE